ncbi:hypothetical protein CROQUDRAFT_42284 [Cronartium quercuum f. sp. fusiforme G11]|uniref:Uncharacterized protein n=1 Tax=Cronartium quercuum f. sp. fusiforme G11 TaxID=708437 RepID=A0A9P6TCX7_9BASI|nr:hypothetical protein CROQUDRAFT_42284 [Cronartium quercuum f. sp. fusiforme G11]
MLTISNSSSLYGQLFELEIPIHFSSSSSSLLSINSSTSDLVQITRSVLFFVPYSLNSKKDLPLLIAFHGSNENGSIFRTRTTCFGYDELAYKNQFVIAYPSGYDGNWNDSRRAVNYPAKIANVDDLRFTREIIDVSHKHWFTSPSKTLIIGYSNGGHMCYKIALELGSSLIAGVGIHCANLPTWENSDGDPLEADAVPICIINGTADPVNPWVGGVVSIDGKGEGTVNARGAHQSSMETMDYFVNRFLERGDQLETEEIEDEEELLDIHQFRSIIDGRLKVQLIAMIGEGHYVPVGTGEKKALVIGPRRGAVHAPRCGKLNSLK